MKISYNWIKEFVDLDVDVHSAASALTLSGTEVEDITHQSVPKEVICARVLDAKKHPHADKLFVCTVDTGKETFQVVCGAPNTRAGMMSAFAPVGCDLGAGMLVKKAKIRSEESFGVLLSERELGLTDDHTGIMEFDMDTKPGDVLVDALGLEDWVLEVNVTPNRGDCLSVIGIARELAALFGKKLKKPVFAIKEEDTPIESVLSVEILSPEGCPRYTARYMDGIAIRKSPFSMRRRLFQSGVRAISNVVDITNYVMLEYGQPLHAFDSTFIAGGGIVVRKARDGETFTTLDSVERTLRAEDLLICDKQKPVALAGVMGGENSEVLDTTTGVILESAFFDPKGIRRTSKGLGLSTEASYRFERGIDPSIQADAASRAAWLMARYADAKVFKGVIDVNYFSYEKREVNLRKSYLVKVLGLREIKPEDVERIFTGLGCEVRGGDDLWIIAVPVFRHDLVREIDLVEEFVRVYGMDKVEPELPTFKPEKAVSGENGIQGLRLSLAALGFTELVTYSFIAPKWKAIFTQETLDLLNPISDEMKVMRMSLLPGLAGAIERNRKLAVRDISLFEIGKCFSPIAGQKLPNEYNRLGIAMT
ncbi:MAG: phenylalanine--tRNA ligase subunit beta, partial [Desulfomonilia bacterium]